MKPTPDDVLTALELVSARVPDRHITPDQAIALSWHADLASFSRAALFSAARSWSSLRFPAAVEFAGEVRTHHRRLLAEERERYAGHELDTGPCPEGCIGGWIDGEEVHRGMTYHTTRPCEVHLPVAYAVWRHRSARPDHDPHRCADCTAVATGKEPLPAWLVEARQVAAAGPAHYEQF